MLQILTPWRTLTIIWMFEWIHAILFHLFSFLFIYGVYYCSFLDECRYLVPADLTVGQFVYVVRKRIKLSPEKAIFIFVKNILPPTGNIYGFCGCVCGILWFLWLILWSELWFSVYAAAMMSAIYEENKDEDGFLYMTYSGENTFGLVFWNNPWLVTIWIVLPKIDQCEEVSLIVNSLVWCFYVKFIMSTGTYLKIVVFLSVLNCISLRVCSLFTPLIPDLHVRLVSYNL